MTGPVAVVLIVCFALLVGLVVHNARRGALGSGALVGLALVCATALLAMVLTDWLFTSISEFWGEHTVVAATLCTLLLAGAGFLAFEARENLEQTRATESLATAAFGGLVDHMLDIDLALSSLPSAAPPAGMRTDGRPLRWVREQRDELIRLHPHSVEQGEWNDGPHDPWREVLLDQAVRRVMAAMRDWAPLLTQTRDGTGVLVRVGHLRNHLLVAQQAVQADQRRRAQDEIRFVRQECRVLALGLELGSGLGVAHVRPRLRASLGLDHDLDHQSADGEMAQLRNVAASDTRQRRIGARLAAGATRHQRTCTLRTARTP